MQDVGHSGVSRRRVYTIVALKEAVDIIKNPIEMYSEVVDFPQYFDGVLGVEGQSHLITSLRMPLKFSWMQWRRPVFLITI